MQMTGSRRRALGVFALMLVMVPPAGCGLFADQRILFDRQDTRIGVEKDPTVSRPDPPAYNNHPAELTPEALHALLHPVQVSGYSGTLVGMLETPRPVPLFTPKQLATIAGPLAVAFHEAKPTERVFFSLPKPDVIYSEDRTEGALFLRGRYLHIVVTDHSAFIRTDTGGGAPEYPQRDTKSLKLWIAGQAQAATVPDAEEPRWTLFEPVHISLNVKDVLALERLSGVRAGNDRPMPASPPAAPLQQRAAPPASPDDLQLQIRELTKSNLDLRERLEAQTKRMQTLTEEMERLRLDLEKAKPSKPSRKPSQQ